jgi:hypothetical protein
MDTKQLRAWKSTLEAEISAITDKIDALSAESQKKRQQLELVSKLLASEAPVHQAVSTSAKPALPKQRPVPTTTPDEVKDRVLEILAEKNRPMNIKEIHTEFVRRGLPIPGQGTPFNILVHMSREIRKGNASRFYRTGKGTYAQRGKSDQTTVKASGSTTELRVRSGGVKVGA